MATEAPAARSGDFWVSEKTTFVGMAASETQDFGAGAVAVLFGGAPVEQLTDRKPGDLQQRIKTNPDGTFIREGGHSSQVHTVEGTGVCKLIPGDSKANPIPINTSKELPEGWYEGSWRLTPDTGR